MNKNWRIRLKKRIGTDKARIYQKALCTLWEISPFALTHPVRDREAQLRHSHPRTEPTQTTKHISNLPPNIKQTYKHRYKYTHTEPTQTTKHISNLPPHIKQTYKHRYKYTHTHKQKQEMKGHRSPGSGSGQRLYRVVPATSWRRVEPYIGQW